ncbi:hypothetical protein CYMTET_15580 [Cymbomonas tetramitiformis]|uniref:Uncharacterized protein n=1 Tax=Cymbomonas tetramitiformis TaxID=36881 RepID=A0AAE0L904_9CHLO|nr:hypothetical protein CYMTET_15580 [Cymbomonas tetramitiformis]
MEEFIKNNPAKESLCRERLAKRKKRMLASKSGEVIEKAAAAVSSSTEKMTDEEIWKAEEHDERRVLHYDSMATRTVLNDLTFFEGGTVCAEKAVQFKVMAGEDPACTKFLLVLPHKPHVVWWGLTKKLEEL